MNKTLALRLLRERSKRRKMENPAKDVHSPSTKPTRSKDQDIWKDIEKAPELKLMLSIKERLEKQKEQRFDTEGQIKAVKIEYGGLKSDIKQVISHQTQKNTR